MGKWGALGHLGEVGRREAPERPLRGVGKGIKSTPLFVFPGAFLYSCPQGDCSSFPKRPGPSNRRARLAPPWTLRFHAQTSAPRPILPRPKPHF